MNYFSWLSTDNLWDTYKYAVYAGVGLGAVGALSESTAEFTDTDKNDRSDFLGNTVDHLREGGRVVVDTAYGGVRGGLLVATAPVSVPYYVYRTSRREAHLD